MLKYADMTSSNSSSIWHKNRMECFILRHSASPMCIFHFKRIPALQTGETRTTKPGEEASPNVEDRIRQHDLHECVVNRQVLCR